MGYWDGKKTLGMIIITVAIEICLWRLDFAGAMALKTKIIFSFMVPLLSGVILFFRDPGGRGG